MTFYSEEHASQQLFRTNLQISPVKKGLGESLVLYLRGKPPEKKEHYLKCFLIAALIFVNETVLFAFLDAAN